MPGAVSTERPKRGSQARVKRPLRILLTGGAGVIGRALLRHLGSHSVVWLTHRSPLGHTSDSVLPGDVRRPGLGLSRPERESLAGTDWIVHSAAVTDFAAPQNSILETNVEGTRNVVELAATLKIPMLHVSTAFVLSNPTALAVDARAEGYMVYAESKRLAEQIVGESDIDAVIVRPSIVLGDSGTGSMARFQGLHMMMAAFLKGCLPVLPAPANCHVDFVPQDLVADAIAGLMEQGVKFGDFWVTAGHRAMTLESIIEVCLEFAAEIGRPIPRPRIIDPEVFSRLIGPAFLSELPMRMRATIDQILGLSPYFHIQRPFPSSLPELQDALGISPLPEPRQTLRRSLEYWARASGVVGG